MQAVYPEAAMVTTASVPCGAAHCMALTRVPHDAFMAICDVHP